MRISDWSSDVCSSDLLLALRRAGAGSGQFRPSNRSTIMSQLSLSLDTPLMVRDGRGRYRPADADQILEAARQVIEQKMQRGEAFTSPVAVKDYLRAKLAGFEHEVFAVLFLDTRHRLIDYVEMFHGTRSEEHTSELQS